MPIFPFFKRRACDLSGVYSEEDFKAAVEREKGRANRTGDSFSLVVFEADHKNTDRPFMQRIAESLRRRSRVIDIIGWFDSNRIGIVLPGTAMDGARKFSDAICEKHLPGQGLISNIYTYPSDWLNLYKNLTDSQSPNSSVDTEDSAEKPSARVEAPKHTRVIGSRQGPTAVRPLSPWKRGLDVLGSIIGLVLFSPLFLAVAILIKLVSPGPVFFRQQRVGYDGKPFTFIKFRTLQPDAATGNHQKHLANLITCECEEESSGGSMVKLDDDPQIIPFGRILRKTCIDELPQLVNVLRGEMSLVGPRPPIPYEVQHYLCWHNGRFDAVPGMTGLWQVSGKNKLTFKEMVRLDIQYARKQNLWFDIKILLKTPWAIAVQILDCLKQHPTTERLGGNA